MCIAECLFCDKVKSGVFVYMSRSYFHLINLKCDHNPGKTS